MAISSPPTPPSRSTPSTFSVLADAFIAWWTGTFVAEFNAAITALNLNDTTANSTTSLAIGTGSKSLTVDTAKSYQPGMSVKIARTAAPSNWMHGDVTSYNAGTGALVVNVLDILGSGTFTDWTVTFSAPSPPFASAAQITAGIAGLMIAPDQAVQALMTKTGSNLAIGSDADGDMYYRASGVLARLAKGAENLPLRMNAAGTGPEYSAGSVVTVHTHDVSSTGNQTLAGAGFLPRHARIMYYIADVHIGFGISDGNLQYCTHYDAAYSNDPQGSSSNCVAGYTIAGHIAYGSLTLNSDGGVMAWAKANTPTGTMTLVIEWFR